MKKIHLISLISAITISAITFIYCQAQDAKTGTKVGDKAIDLAFTTPEEKPSIIIIKRQSSFIRFLG